MNVEQSDDCIEDVKGEGHIREQHGDLTGGDVRKLRGTKVKIEHPDEVGNIEITFAALMPIASAAHFKTGAEKTKAAGCFALLHKLWTLFDKAAEVRLNSEVDGSKEHQALVTEFYTMLVTKVNGTLVRNMPEGRSFMTWPDHYVLCHLSDDMERWWRETGVPFGRTSNQVNERLNKVVKRYLTRTNNHQSSTDLADSKWFQVIFRLAVRRLLADDVENPRKRKAPEKCKCGSTSHLTTQAAACPLNQKKKKARFGLPVSSKAARVTQPAFRASI